VANKMLNILLYTHYKQYALTKEQTLTNLQFGQREL